MGIVSMLSRWVVCPCDRLAMMTAMLHKTTCLADLTGGSKPGLQAHRIDCLPRRLSVLRLNLHVGMGMCSAVCGTALSRGHRFSLSVKQAVAAQQRRCLSATIQQKVAQRFCESLRYCVTRIGLQVVLISIGRQNGFSRFHLPPAFGRLFLLQRRRYRLGRQASSDRWDPGQRP